MAPNARRLLFSPFTSDELIEIENADDARGDPVASYNGILACSRFDVLDKLPDIKAPTCIIVGKDDVNTPVVCSEALVKKLPNAAMTVLEKAAHMIIVEQPDAVNKCIMEFMDKELGL